MRADQQVSAFIRGLDSAAAVAPVWDEYTLANHPIVLVSQATDSAGPACAMIWRHRRPPIVVRSSAHARFSTPLYGMWNVDSTRGTGGTSAAAIATTLRRLPPETERALADIGETRAVFLPVPLRLETLGALGRSLREMKVDVRVMLLQLAVHESYHLHSQFPVWLGQRGRYAWPSWDIQPDRRALVQRCYGENAEVKSTHARELQLLLAAWDTLATNSSAETRRQALEFAKQYVDARRQRYGMLTAVTISSAEGGMSCERAESMMELEEGAPQWMAYATLTRAGLMDARKSGRASNEAFYVSGAYQLWILERLLGSEELRRLSAEMTRAPGPDPGLFTRFASFVTSTR